MIELSLCRHAHAGLIASCLAGLVALSWPSSAGAVDVNRATVDQLQIIKGIGSRMAANIIAERTSGGPFASLDEVADRVRGIGAKSIIRLRAGGLKVVAPVRGGASSTGTAMAPRRPIAPPAGLSSVP
jgi:competence protein ComEA